MVCEYQAASKSSVPLTTLSLVHPDSLSSGILQYGVLFVSKFIIGSHSEKSGEL